ncbi:molybdenum cofactor biosynthesis F family protein [Pseudomonas sp. DTU_2021_1001937_2_SI_NGA_ILE_001]|uniref:molybdenum cofactor biosynthesis F family protein n=1 Tax=Pseudomonas sp. DTU_2021_1001937_2_SI_NGA_ILE_001 TaxID=3077589 RepID=UPI0028FC149E|nr:molybdenum cofactor biosynthesis F family protein [Pseudomonas sp. DTU_2021_1001937_2_SI_NGA_ILE_001]WNW11198.1 molybdenum cofactor biosynthesis F family protein [Pseudomonas sp. DTU_2021_1001937_2_SI_NGA_ILE_001]
MSTHQDWITVGALADGFAPEAFILPNLAELAGRAFELHFANGWRISHRFDAAQVHWQAADGHSQGSATYRATSLRNGIYLVDFLKHEDGRDWSISLVLDTLSASFTAVIGSLPDQATTHEGLYHRALAGKPLTGVQVQFLHGSLDTPWREGACPHAPTLELVGLRNLYRYSPTEVYEHVYLNGDYYSWQCLSGVEKGLCDTDRAHYYKLAEQLYLFVWREKIVPTLGLIVIDLQQHRSDGKIFGYAGDRFDTLSNFPVASYCRVLNTTEYGLDD